MNDRKGKGSTNAERSAKSGKFATVVAGEKKYPLKGYGSMKGQLSLKKGVDLGKPVSAQVGKSRSARTLTQSPAPKKK
jgi:hypothetical protein